MKYVTVVIMQFLSSTNLQKTIIFIFLVLADWLSKYFIFNYIDLYQFIRITNFLDITHTHNFGVSFGLFSETILSLAIIAIGLIVTIFVIFLFINSNEYLERWGLFIIICGAIANIVDRTINGYVIDFIYFHINQFDWPVFNFADIYISIGIMMIIINMLKKISKN